MLINMFLYASFFSNSLLRMALLTVTFMYRFLTSDLIGWVQMDQRYEHRTNSSFQFSFPSACFLYIRYLFFYNIVSAGALNLLDIKFQIFNNATILILNLTC